MLRLLDVLLSGIFLLVALPLALLLTLALWATGGRPILYHG